MQLNLDNAVNYHYDHFPPKNLDYGRFLNSIIKATDAVARYDQMLKNMHNSEILLAPLRNQEAVISSRMEGTVSTMDEILKYDKVIQRKLCINKKSYASARLWKTLASWRLWLS